METVDPLEELQSKVVSILNRDLQGYSERDITVTLIERIVQGIGQVPHLGLTVEDVEVMSFTSDSRITNQVVEEENRVQEERIAKDKAYDEANAEQFAIYRAEEAEARRIAREKAAAQAEIVKTKLAAKAALEAERAASVIIPEEEIIIKEFIKSQ